METSDQRSERWFYYGMNAEEIRQYTKEKTQSELNKVLAEYLKMGSIDGRMERQPLRKQLKDLLDKLNTLQ